ncbi:unnamed protein product [Chrysoparadoxa australica]
MTSTSNPRAVATLIQQVSLECSELKAVGGKVRSKGPMRECGDAAESVDDADFAPDCGPLCGRASKVMKLQLQGSGNGMSRTPINVYMYDKWAQQCHSMVNAGDTLFVTGETKASVLANPAADVGDHPYCIVIAPRDLFHTRDERLAADTVKILIEAAQGSGSGKRVRVGGGGTLLVSTTAKRRRVAQVQANFVSLKDLPNSWGQSKAKVNVFGVVSSFGHPKPTKGTDRMICVNLIDPSMPDSENSIPCNIFGADYKQLPSLLAVGDMIRLHRVLPKTYNNWPQLVFNKHWGSSWVLVRNRAAARRIRPLPHVPGEGEGEGEAGSLFDAQTYEEQYSTAYVPTKQSGDGEKVKELDEWFQGRFMQIKLCDPKKKLSLSEALTMQATLTESEPHRFSEVDLVAAVVHIEKDSQGIVKELYLWDGTQRPLIADAHGGAGAREGIGRFQQLEPAKIQAGIDKAMAAAVGAPTAPAHLAFKDGEECPFAIARVSPGEHKRAITAFQFRAGVWVRCRKMRLLKAPARPYSLTFSLQTVGSVNLVHPGMVEVQEVIARARELTATAAGTENALAALKQPSHYPLEAIMGGCCGDFPVRVRITKHEPQEVKDMVRDRPGKGLQYLFLLHLADESSTMVAIASGTDAGGLLEGVSPETFNGDAAVRAEFQQRLEELEKEPLNLDERNVSLKIRCS